MLACVQGRANMRRNVLVERQRQLENKVLATRVAAAPSQAQAQGGSQRATRSGATFAGSVTNGTFGRLNVRTTRAADGHSANRFPGAYPRLTS
jgi:hypothetical protein